MMRQGPGRTYRAYGLRTLRTIPQLRSWSEGDLFAMEAVAHVLPFRTNAYVVDQLIDWSAVPDDPIFRLTFPQREMLLPAHFEEMASALRSGASSTEIFTVADRIRRQLNPHPAGQKTLNVPKLEGRRLPGLQHKYRETVLFFPSAGQTCHAYCAYCFRWPQFVGTPDLRFAAKEASDLVAYLWQHPEVSDVLVTGGDPMIMKARTLRTYLEPLLREGPETVRSIRIGTKALGFWPYRFLTDRDADDVLRLFEMVVSSGRHLALMAHFSHPRELQSRAVEDAIRRIRATGAAIRSQAPVMRGINDTPEVWAEMWQRQVELGVVPYYMFIARDTGAQHEFGVPLIAAWKTFRGAYNRVSGLARTVRGPVMSCRPGKIQVLGGARLHGERLLGLRFIQGRNPEWVQRPFFARYDESALWLDDLRPLAPDTHFFFEEGAAGPSRHARTRSEALLRSTP